MWTEVLPAGHLNSKDLKGLTILFKMPGKKGKQASINERRRVVELRMEGCSISEVAQRLNRSKGFVKKQWARRH